MRTKLGSSMGKDHEATEHGATRVTCNARGESTLSTVACLASATGSGTLNRLLLTSPSHLRLSPQQRGHRFGCATTLHFMTNQFNNLSCPPSFFRLLPRNLGVKILLFKCWQDEVLSSQYCSVEGARCHNPALRGLRTLQITLSATLCTRAVIATEYYKRVCA